jgi:excisionase family DNA binding protein
MPRSRRPSWRSVKIHRNYTVDEASRLTGYAKGTIRRWIRSDSLPAIDDRKPVLILGTDLHAYFSVRARSGPKLQPDECYCLKCRAPRRPALGMVDYVPLTANTGNLTAICEVCSTLMHKAISLSSIGALSGVLDVTMREANKRLADTSNPTLHDHLAKEPEVDA